MASKFLYDVFLSHSGKGVVLARQVVRQLRSAGLSVFFEEDSIRRGEHEPDEIQTAASSSRRIALLLSKGMLDREWSALKAAAAIVARPDIIGQRVVLVLIEPIEAQQLPAWLRGLELFDFLDLESRDRKYQQLLEALLWPEGEFPPPPDWRTLRPDPHESRLTPRLVHDLPPAPHFVGRGKEIDELYAFWDAPQGGVLSIVGIGGSGKTAIVKRFCSELLAGEDLPQGFFVWSFYEDPDPAAFLEAAYEYFSGERRPEVKGAGWLHLLKDALSDGKSYLLVLDGLERVQRQSPERQDGHEFGELEDSLLREFLKRIAQGAGRAKAIITTRFPVVDLSALGGGGYRSLDLGQLDERSALKLLRSNGVQGYDGELRKLIEKYGCHALTLDHLGTLLGRFFDGKCSFAPIVGLPELSSPNRQSHHLASVFKAYEKCLREAELAVLGRLCVFRFGVTAESFYQSFVHKASKGVAGPLLGSSPEEVHGLLETLVGLHLVLREGARRYTVHPAVRDHFYQSFASPLELHEAAGRHFDGLAGRPGTELPYDKWTLDQLEELIFHLLAASGVKEAEAIYRHRLGGVRHLTELGDFSRGLRILRQFPRVIDADGLLRFRRGVGDLPDEAEWRRYEGNLTYFSSFGRDCTLLLRGRLKDTEITAAQFLRGEDVHPFFSEDFAPRFSAVLLSRKGSEELTRTETEVICRDGDGVEYAYDALAAELLGDRRFHIFFEENRDRLQADFEKLRSVAGSLENLAIRRYVQLNYELEKWPRRVAALHGGGCEMAVCHLWIAELSRMEGDLAPAHSHLEMASRWILRASSQEHLALLHLVRARLATDAGEYVAAASALSEGIDIARACRFRIFLIDLLNASARLNVYRHKPADAEEAAREAMALAGAEECGYVWGKALAVHYLHHVLAEAGEARRAGELLTSNRLLLERLDRSPFLADLKLPLTT